MKIYEVIYNNGQSYEDNYTKSYYYETLAEAEARFEDLKNDEDDCYYDEAFVVINELELGTQYRDTVKREMCCPSRYEALARKRAEAYERYKAETKGGLEMPSIPQTTLADIDALVALRDKLAGR